MVYHYDSVKVTQLREDEKGYLKVKGTIARVGDLTYLNSDGTARVEYVPPETLFDESHLKSIANSDFVEGHPAMINADNYRQHTIGSIGSNVFANAIRDDEDNLIDGDVQVFYTIKHKDAVKKVKEGRVKGLSMGYEVKVKRDDDRFIQLERRCNHHGLVEYPRCEGAKLHLDSAESYWVGETEFDLNFDEFVKPIIKPVKLFFFADNYMA